MNTKICTKCKQEKVVSCFSKLPTKKDGLHSNCRECRAASHRAWYNKNREHCIQYATQRAKTETAVARRKEQYQENRDEVLANNRIRRQSTHAKKLANENRRRLYNSDISFRMAVNLRTRIRKAMKGTSKSKTTLDFLGCSMEAFKVHLESQFVDGMTWENYGFYGWHIDHKRPCASFDLSDAAQQRTCFHYTNLQPLWWRDNLSKNATFPLPPNL